MAKGSVGKIVTYVGGDAHHDEHPAIVTGVHDDGCLDLTVFFRASGPGWRIHIRERGAERVEGVAYGPGTWAS